MKDCVICLDSKIVYYKLYRDPYFLLILNFYWNELSIDFIIGLLLSVNWKSKSYNRILVIVDWLIKIVQYKAIKSMIDILGQAELIINVIKR